MLTEEVEKLQYLLVREFEDFKVNEESDFNDLKEKHNLLIDNIVDSIEELSKMILVKE